MRKVLTIIGAGLLCMMAQPLYAAVYSPDDVQQSMASLLYEIEEAAGIEHKASQAIRDLNEEGKEVLYNSVANQEKFVNSAYKALERIESAKKAAVKEALQMPEMSTRLLLTPSPTTSPYTPNYPPTYSAAYNIAMVLGLTSSNEDRCDGLGLEIYEDALYAAEKLSDVTDAICNGAGCDPSGVVCIVACLAAEGYKLAVYAAKIPLDACNKHGEGVNDAEIEAGYENSVRILNDLGTVLRNQDDILENQGESLDNQEEIIRLLKTPQGKRPGWNKTINSMKMKK